MRARHTRKPPDGGLVREHVVLVLYGEDGEDAFALIDLRLRPPPTRADVLEPAPPLVARVFVDKGRLGLTKGIEYNLHGHGVERLGIQLLGRGPDGRSEAFIAKLQEPYVVCVPAPLHEVVLDAKVARWHRIGDHRWQRTPSA